MIENFRNQLLIERKQIEKQLSPNSENFIKAISFCKTIEIGINKLEDDTFRFTEERTLQINTIKSYFRLLHQILNNENEK